MASTSLTKNMKKAIEEPVKENGIWIFVDTECKADKKVCYTWNSFFHAFQDKEFLMLLHNDASTKMSKEIYRNIIKSGLHRVAMKTLVLPCLDVIEWITRKDDHQHRSILNFEGKVVASYKASMMNQMYHLKESSIKISPEWLKQKSESADLLTILEGWWFEEQFRSKSVATEWKTLKFIKSVQIILILLSRVFMRKDGSTFPDKWIPIIYQIITSGATLNWGELISSNLDNQLKKVHKDNQFYMSTYLMIVMCANIEFPSLEWKWESSLPSIHVYCKMLWETKYKEDYDQICNKVFLALYQVFFGEEAPCLSYSNCMVHWLAPI